MPDRFSWNAPRFDPSSAGGHYESWYQRGNHPSEPRAFWTRYTIFAARGRPASEGIGELWAVYFNATKSPPSIVAVRETRPLSQCVFGSQGHLAKIGEAHLAAESLHGSVSDRGHSIGWALRYTSPQPPVLLMPEALYSRRLPPAKSLVGSPNAVFDGSIEVDGTEIPVEGWTGCQAHNWGLRQSDTYFFGQVSPFDEADSFLECISIRYRVGPFTLPPLTVFSLRVEGERFDCIGPWNGVRTKSRSAIGARAVAWLVEGRANGARIQISFTSALDRFAALGYGNPPGGVKRCLNTKVADCRVSIHRDGVRSLSSNGRALLEILDDPKRLPSRETFPATAGPDEA